jgi:hypothetical protein
MLSVAQLWLPTLAAALGVFVASSLIHMVLKWHNADYQKLPNEDEVASALRKSSLPPGQYVVPYCVGMKDMQSPEMQKKFVEGPVGHLFLRRPGLPKMGPALGTWFALTVAVAAVAAHVGCMTLAAGAPPMRVGHVTGAVTFIAYAAGSVSDGIWLGKPWGSVAKDLLDALIFAAVSGLAFALLWPH